MKREKDAAEAREAFSKSLGKEQAKTQRDAQKARFHQSPRTLLKCAHVSRLDPLVSQV